MRCSYHGGGVADPGRTTPPSSGPLVPGTVWGSFGCTRWHPDRRPGGAVTKPHGGATAATTAVGGQREAPGEAKPTTVQHQQEDSYNSEPFTASELGLYQDCMEPLPASSQPPVGEEDARPLEHWRGWLGLQHTTASQAQAALGSPDLDAVGEPTLPATPAGNMEHDAGHASLATTVPWNPPPPGETTAGPSAHATQVDLDGGTSTDHSESADSHP